MIAFGVGLLADFFVSSPGIHASACLWLIVLRMFLLQRQDLKQHEANKRSYNVSVAGFAPFISTVSILVVMYHFYIFWLGNIGAVNGFSWLVTSLSSSLLSLTVIGIIQIQKFK